MTAMSRTPCDTIQRLTAAGPAAIGVVRMCGPGVGAFLAHHAVPRSPTEWAAGQVRRVTLRDADGSPLDDALVSVHAITPNWDIRVHLHGGIGLVSRWFELAAAAGFQTRDTPPQLWPVATPIEREACELLPRFTTDAGVAWLRRQAHDLPLELARLLKLDDLPAVRAAAGQIAARLPIAAWFQRPIRIALVGPPNAGKSTLMNALSDREVSLVSERPGTTRDWIEARGELTGFPVVWIDTAGLRSTDDDLESAGISATRRVIAGADLVVGVVGLAEADIAPAIAFRRRFSDISMVLMLLNKSDLARDTVTNPLEAEGIFGLNVSAISGDGIAPLRAALLDGLGLETSQLSMVSCFTDRQRDALLSAHRATDLEACRGAIGTCIGDEL
ncbi:MAG: tRNA modification GTPase MnmE [Phycisphaerae bacterium]|nr:tRNA modification GTPase MnmE [Phycisphaerae bacterium]